MSEPAWKVAERRLAGIFGVRRRPLSGGNQGGGRDDAIHPALYLESKHTQKSSLWTLYRDARKKAGKEYKVPVLGISEKGKPGVLLVIHSASMRDVIVEWLLARGYYDQAKIIGENYDAE